ncbi:hypothetical protein J2Y02_001717 [Neobacillus drentensis]|nr:hypothetical protein [Neobacillus drentensis]
MTNQNFSMYAGDSKSIIIPVTKDDGSPLNLTGAAVKWGVRKRESSTTNDILKESPAITVSGSEITISLAPVDTETLTGSYYHECELTDQQGNVSTLFVGLVTITKSGV